MNKETNIKKITSTPEKNNNHQPINQDLYDSFIKIENLLTEYINHINLLTEGIKNSEESNSLEIIYNLKQKRLSYMGTVWMIYNRSSEISKNSDTRTAYIKEMKSILKLKKKLKLEE